MLQIGEIDEAEKLLKAGFCDCVLKDDVANLYIEAYAVCKKTEKSEALGIKGQSIQQCPGHICVGQIPSAHAKA